VNANSPGGLPGTPLQVFGYVTQFGQVRNGPRYTYT
jgi:hypothetical protein